MSENPEPVGGRAENLELFGRALRDSLAAHRLSQNEFADRIGVSSSAVTSWVLGRKEPHFTMVFAMERELRLAPGSLSRILGFCPCDHAGPTLEGAILVADELNDTGRQAMLLSYQAWSQMNRAS